MSPSSHSLYNITVLKISDSNITYYKSTNETQYPYGVNETIELNIETGDLNDSMIYPAWWFISKDLNAGDPIYSSPTYQNLVINETIVTDHLGLSLATNHLQTNVTYLNLYFSGCFCNVTETSDSYWDRTTGVIVENIVNINQSRSDGSGDSFVTLRTKSLLILSAAPNISEFPSFLILSLFMIATLLAVIVYRRKHRLDNFAVHLSRISNPSM
jgi:hypothetical protein